MGDKESNSGSDRDTGHRLIIGTTREGMSSKHSGEVVSMDPSRDIAVAEFMLKEGGELIDWLSARLTNPSGDVEIRDNAARALAEFIVLKENLQKLVDQIKLNQDHGSLS